MSAALEGVIFLQDVRLSFPHIVDPQESKSPEGTVVRTWNADLLLSPDHPGLNAFMRRYGEIALAKWKEHAQTIMGLIQQDKKNRCFGEGNTKLNSKTFQPYEGYAGMIYITAIRSSQPQIIRLDGTPVDPASSMEYQAVARTMYGGCRVNAAIKPWLQDNKHGRAIRCELVAIQFLRDDSAFGSGNVDASSLFGGVSAQPSGTAPSMQGVPGFQGIAAPQTVMPPLPFATPATQQGIPFTGTVPGIPSFLK